MNPDSKKAAKINEGAIMKALDWGYDKSVNGLPGVDSAIELAEDYMKVGGTKNSQVTSLIRWQLSKAGTSGFLTGFGGLITMPITIPANLASVMFIQIRMIAAIAHIGGYDLKDDRVKSLVYACMAGNAAKDILKDIGIVIGTKLTTQAIKSISGKTLVAINQRVGFRLLTKFGSKGAINLGKAVPIIGGIVGGTFDVVTTNIIGNVAKKAFIDSIEESKKNWWEVPVVQLDQSVKELEQQTAKWSQQPKDDSQKEEITEDINSTYSFSLFPNLLTAEHPDDNIDINQLYDMIKDGYVKDKISKLRYAINDKEEYTRIKKELLPAVTLSGTFNHRNAEGLIEHSGLLQVDIDHVEDVDELFKTICEDYYTYMCFRSPGGQGIKVVVKINPSVESHKQQFFAIERYYHDQFDIDIGKSVV